MSTMRPLQLLFAMLLATAPLAHAADAPPDVQAEFSTAVTLLQAEKFADALPLLREVATKVPDPSWRFLEPGHRRGDTRRKAAGTRCVVTLSRADARRCARHGED